MPFFVPSASACASSASASASGACARLLGRRPNEALRSRLMFAGDVSLASRVPNDERGEQRADAGGTRETEGKAQG